MDTIAATGLSAFEFWDNTISKETNIPIKMDLIETDKAFVVKAHVPGVSKDNLKIIFENDVLTVTANRIHSNTYMNGERVHLKECFSNSSSRSLRFQHGKIDANDIHASYVDGELSIVLNFDQSTLEKRTVNVKII